jgi:dTDP-4-amino-4,6-dideoxygalactose transaminase
MNVPLFELKTQYAALRDEIRPVIERVLDSQMFILGAEVAELEREVAAYCETTEAVGCASGSDAILLALLALGIGPGDQVIVPSYTFFATAGYVVRVGATPVFADIDPVTYNIDPESIRAAAARCSNLRAIMPVHLYGQSADMAALEAIGLELGVPLVEDAAQAIGTRDPLGRPAGAMSTLGCFSFFPTKNLGGFGDGGMVTTSDAELAARLRMLRMHGMEPKYVHRIVGVNSRLDALQAAVLRVKLRHLDAWTAARQRNAAFYDRAFGEIGARTSAEPLDTEGFPLRTPAWVDRESSRHIYNQYVIRVPAAHRDELRDHLRERGVGTEIYYPIPLHLQDCFTGLGYRDGDLPVSERAARETIALPIYPELTEAQLAHVVESVAAYLPQPVVGR